MPRGQLVDGKTKKQWVLEQPASLAPKEVAARATAAGFKNVTNQQVSSIRHAAGMKPGHASKRGRAKARAKRARPAPRERRQDGSEDERALRSLITRLGTLRVLAAVDEFNSLAGR